MTNYCQCDNCRKTSPEHELIQINKEGGRLICLHCWGYVSFAFSACTADQPEPSLGYCDGCDELEAELHLMDGDWLCDKCKATVIAAQEDKAKAQTMGSITINTRHYSEPKLLREELSDLEKGCADHWEMIKARVFITLFVVWVCFALWSKYVP